MGYYVINYKYLLHNLLVKQVLRVLRGSCLKLCFNFKLDKTIRETYGSIYKILYKHHLNNELILEARGSGYIK